MTLWIIFAVLTVLTLLFLTWPLWRPGREVAARSAHDTAVYRDQLGEIDADLDRGLISAAEADSAKIEISRRLLAASENIEAEKARGAVQSRSGLALAGVFVCVPLLSLMLYLQFGSPGMPDQPRSARLQKPEESDSIAALVAKVEARLRANPGDGVGWDVLAPVYLKTRRFQDAADAYRRAISILGESPKRLTGYAEALVLANDGIVSEAARKAYEKALDQNPKSLKARYWLARAKEQDGLFAEAAAAWREMLALGSEDARWRPVVAEHLRVAEARARGEDPSAGKPDDAAPGPTSEQVAAASEMSAEERAAMINRMVEGLAARLKDDGNDLKGWQRLVRAYTVLGKREAAVAALADARRNFDKDSEALTELNALAEQLGL